MKTILEMFKEIEDLELVSDNEGEPLKSVKDIVPNWCNKIEQSLQRLEAIDNATPSEALECLENIEADLTGLPKHVTEYDDGFDNYLEDIWGNVDTIKQALLNNRKENNILKVLKPLCKVKETPEKTVRYLLACGTVVYVFKEIEEYEMFKEWLKDE